ncbi:hypothetical protein K461DRAFT_283679 [Myriangium duriaei CBS 260.36]|uniref:histidine kinase n=1 Tax=Myriangium duriaei CBS 260.36 TaxID=1168546 RepID=A0A9P4MJ75_9PEZI|nr:hypothetical protein K461DRAFT_283679 [Myriangium duriaei CBS 260.36]
MPGDTGATPEHRSRTTICLSQPKPDVVIHHGDEGFTQELGKLYSTSESELLEGLIELKTALKSTPHDEFWSFLSERMAELLGAQMSFISKRMLVDDQDRAVEMPPIGEPGACLMASALYYNDGMGTQSTLKAFKYHAYGCPCGYMRHDKVFIIPDNLENFTPGSSNPNDFPFKLESYIGIPLFAEGKCFAHFGVIWSPEGAKQKRLPWATIELFLHSLEDIILERLLEGSQFRENDVQVHGDRNRIIPHAAITAAQSLKPYARSLSHELRTPMQGVVGMLDVMYATVLEAYENQTNSDVRQIFETLKDNIEMVQDSSRRAVEAADNVVHAYDMDMHIPDAPHSIMTGATSNNPILTPVSMTSHDRPGILVAGSNLPIQRPNKRRRGDDTDAPNKIPATISEWTKRAEPSEELKQGVHEAEDIPDEPASAVSQSAAYEVTRIPSPPKGNERTVAPGLRHTQIRNVLQYVVNEGLKVGGRPESAIARETDLGEIIEVKSTNATGELRTKVIEWSVDAVVPTTMFVDEKDLGKLISCVFLNAIKFTEQGKINVTARMSTRSRHVVVGVSDSGPGIPKAFLPKLFKPFSQEDPSLTRQSEGLGLGLLVAKGLARKLGGDLMCTRADTEGPNRGSEFEVRIPVSPSDTVSRPPSPFDSPSSNKSGRLSQLSDELTPKFEPFQKNPLPTPVTETDETPVAKPTSDPASNLKPPTSGLLRKPSLPQTPKVETPGFRFPTIPPSPSPNKPPMSVKRPAMMPRKSSASMSAVDRNLADKYPLKFLVAEDNKINRKLLVSMLSKFGYKNIHEAYDGAEAVRQMEKHKPIDVVLMDLWMPFMDGYEATEKILQMDWTSAGRAPTVLAVTADVTDGALDRAAKVGMKGFMTKPFKLLDLQRLILEYCSQQAQQDE